MSHYINVFLKTELTSIPFFLNKIFGKYYNNTVCNGATWLLLIWFVLHLIFDKFLNALLRKMRFQEYVRIRLKQCLWYLGFYMSAFIYCEATMIQNNLPILSLKKSVNNYDESERNLLLGIILMATFFLHSALWECLQYSRPMPAVAFFLLSLFLSTSYFLSLFNYSFVIPFTIILPFGRGSTTIFSMSKLFLLFTLIFWLIIEFYTSVLCKSVYHWLYHSKVDNLIPCGIDLIECASFPPRDDVTYNLLVLRKEIQEREDKSMLLRRPKNRNMVVQTLKCMVALKRKLKEQRQASSDENKNITIEDITDKLIDNDDSNDDIAEGEVTLADSEEVEGKLQFNLQNTEKK